MWIVPQKKIDEEIIDNLNKIEKLEDDKKVIRRYAANSRAAFDLLLEIREEIEKLNQRIAHIEAYRTKHYK